MAAICVEFDAAFFSPHIKPIGIAVKDSLENTSYCIKHNSNNSSEQKSKYA